MSYLQKNITYLIDSKQISSNKLLELTGHNSTGLVSMWKNGTRNMRIDDVVKLTNFLNYTIDDLINKDLKIEESLSKGFELDNNYVEKKMLSFFNKNLKYIRTQKGLSQQELADNLKLDRSTISRWENDEMDITVSNAIKISNLLNIPLEDLTEKDLTNSSRPYDELSLLFKKNRNILTKDDEKIIRFLIENRKRDIDKQNHNE